MSIESNGELGLFKKSVNEVLRRMDPEFREALKLMPSYQPHPKLPSDWFQWQVIERYTVLKHAELVDGANVLEVGCGPQAVATIPLASTSYCRSSVEKHLAPCWVKTKPDNSIQLLC